MRILITGGLGYVGGRLANYLKKARPNSDIYLTTTRKKYPDWTEAFNVLSMNLLDDTTIQKSVGVSQPNVIIHLSSMAQDECQESPQKAFDVNVEGTRKLINTASRFGVEKFILFSTFQIYGVLEGEISEKSLPNPAPHRIYPQTKWEAEKILREAKELQTLVFRLSNSYGAPMDGDVADHVKGLVFNAFCRDCLIKQEIAPLGNAYRDFIAMHDVLRAIEHFLFVTPDDWRDGLFNLGGGCCLSIIEVAYKVAEIFEKHTSRKVFVHEPPHNDGGQQFHYNVDKLRSIGFRWQGNMEEEVLQTLRLFEETVKENT